MAVASSLQCLVYVSKIARSGLHNLRPAVRSILAQAQRLNARDSVTGLLVFNRAFFVQVLEGEPE